VGREREEFGDQVLSCETKELVCPTSKLLYMCVCVCMCVCIVYSSYFSSIATMSTVATLVHVIAIFPEPLQQPQTA